LLKKCEENGVHSGKFLTMEKYKEITEGSDVPREILKHGSVQLPPPVSMPEGAFQPRRVRNRG
jgi:hypothetical protein